LWAFLDLQADSLPRTYPCGSATCVEPAVAWPDSVTVTPGATITIEKLLLKRREN